MREIQPLGCPRHAPPRPGIELAPRIILRHIQRIIRHIQRHIQPKRMGIPRPLLHTVSQHHPMRILRTLSFPQSLENSRPLAAPQSVHLQIPQKKLILLRIDLPFTKTADKILPAARRRRLFLIRPHSGRRRLGIHHLDRPRSPPEPRTAVEQLERQPGRTGRVLAEHQIRKLRQRRRFPLKQLPGLLRLPPRRTGFQIREPPHRTRMKQNHILLPHQPASAPGKTQLEFFPRGTHHRRSLFVEHQTVLRRFHHPS